MTTSKSENQILIFHLGGLKPAAKKLFAGVFSAVESHADDVGQPNNVRIIMPCGRVPSKVEESWPDARPAPAQIKRNIDGRKALSQLHPICNQNGLVSVVVSVAFGIPCSVVQHQKSKNCHLVRVL